jgi:ssDNA-binding Zn-finger/Zn-ribbon topoisomerase 1
MGSSFGISCRECDYSKNFKIGIGMMYSPYHLRDFDSEFALLPYLIRSKKTLAHIKELLNEKNAEIADDYGHKIYRCPKCGEFYGRFYLRLEYDGGFFEVEYRCTKCKKALKLFDYDVIEVGGSEKEINLEKYPCPKCGKYSLYEGGTLSILWD